MMEEEELTPVDGEGSAVCEIVHTKSESEGRPEGAFQLCCSSPEGRKDFLKTVHSILREKHRRQLLKTESLPLSQQYVPFGGKRLCALKGARPVINRAASAPTRTLGRRKLVRNRFTIDTDIVFDGDPDPAPAPAPPPDGPERLQRGHSDPQQHRSDTDRWVEEQFDLEEYEDRDEAKETDILSDDDDDFCRRLGKASVEDPASALSLESEETEESEDLVSPTDDVKRLSVGADDDEVWVRRASPDCEE